MRKLVWLLVFLTTFSTSFPGLAFAQQAPTSGTKKRTYYAIRDYGITMKGLRDHQPPFSSYQIVHALIKLSEDGYFDMRNKEQKIAYLRSVQADSSSVVPAILAAEERSGWESVKLAKYADETVSGTESRKAGFYLAEKLRAELEEALEICRNTTNKNKKSTWSPTSLDYFYEIWLPPIFTSNRNKPEWDYAEKIRKSPDGARFLTPEKKKLYDERYYVTRFAHFCIQALPELKNIDLDTLDWVSPVPLTAESILFSKFGRIARAFGLPQFVKNVTGHVASRVVATKKYNAVATVGIKVGSKVYTGFNWGVRIVSTKFGRINVALENMFARSFVSRELASRIFFVIDKTINGMTEHQYLRKYINYADLIKIYRRIRIVDRCTIDGFSGCLLRGGQRDFTIEIRQYISEDRLSQINFDALREISIHELHHYLYTKSKAFVDNTEGGLQGHALDEGMTDWLARVVNNDITKLNKPVVSDSWYTGYYTEVKVVEALYQATVRKLRKQGVRNAEEKAKEEFFETYFNHGHTPNAMNRLVGVKWQGGYKVPVVRNNQTEYYDIYVVINNAFDQGSADTHLLGLINSLYR